MKKRNHKHVQAECWIPPEHMKRNCSWNFQRIASASVKPRRGVIIYTRTEWRH